MDRQPIPLVKGPDFLTALRFPLAVLFVLVPDSGVRLAVLIAASASDVLDGIWARRVGSSRLGIPLDPISDKFFMVLTFMTVFREGGLSPMELGAVLLRDLTAVVTFAGALVVRRPMVIPARAGGKAVTILQGLTLVAFVVGWDLVGVLAWTTGIVSVYAIIDYIREARRP